MNAREIAENADEHYADVVRIHNQSVDARNAGADGLADDLAEQAESGLSWVIAQSLLAIALALTEPRPAARPRQVQL
ncbi:MAG: hypothetical protein DI570_25645 [Phenylobacterium zucineum]|nr:MAG: hypothetical protein DI570_25645 [Phenylobacterium zucineum]